MFIAWFIGLLLNLIVVFLWHCKQIHYVNTKKHTNYWGRMRVNILVAILFIITSFVPILNITLATSLWTPLIFLGDMLCDDGCDEKWNFPKWMNKTIK